MPEEHPVPEPARPAEADRRAARRVTREIAARCEPLREIAGRIVVAVSGGCDSTVLARALTHRRPPPDNLCLAHIHHGLRGDEADADAAFVRALGEKWNAPAEVVRVDPLSLRDDASSRERPTVQEAGRILRYRALRELAGSDGVVLTAHHAGDQAETVLLRLFRGTTPEGLAGIPRVSPDGRTHRPLLGVSREDIEAYARHHGVDFREDSSNRDPKYARNALRHQWLPRLSEAFNPRLLRALGRLADAQRQDADWMAQHAAEAFARRVVADGDVRTIDLRGWSALHPAEARRVAALLLTEMGMGRDVSRVHIERALACFRGGRAGAEFEFPGGVRLRRSGERALCWVVPVSRESEC